MRKSVVGPALIILSIGLLVVLSDAFSQRLSAEQDAVLAMVNDTLIYRSQLDPVIDQYKKARRKSIVKEEEKIELLKGVVRRNLILQQKEAQKLRRSQEIIDKVKAYEDQLVVETYLKNHVSDFLTVSEEEIRKYYQNNLYQFASPPKVKASHILLRDEKESQMVLKKLRAGEDFSELAKQYSIDLPMALEGGSMGVIEKGKTLPVLETALFTLNEGEYSEVVKTQFGYHILKVDEKISEGFTPLEEVKDSIKTSLLKQKEAQAFNRMVETLENDAKITIYQERL